MVFCLFGDVLGLLLIVPSASIIITKLNMLLEDVLEVVAADIGTSIACV